MSKEVYLLIQYYGYGEYDVTECEGEEEALTHITTSTRVYKATPLQLTFKEVET